MSIGESMQQQAEEFRTRYTAVKDEICQSDGCPTVSPGLLQYLKPIINASKKPVLLWIYE